ncbi:MBL fold metallo-hydrolase [Rhodoplanes sp. TEM]|uniref:MBL fold metallo-hydrolase n=1 Tax=Rhodoplanes tepidamans TaxID=200616 RepID=A0ABT5JFY8_RHOTP|nr:MULTISPECIES: MBL fold metallo-hydrolase [Rhodoplanes]MDC7787940.1 MBL fold metallo-hydrolase [Rhodoplanes tepidamans]MDC7986914.1 MBL fold metallo-hydrolase [Rhodoplanes sp. TEM]MDQ0358369.1 glyoxylase-like metal-dependent hydrolase (beta-lactamase superfamily II) [Rhodoplanes tepidamans]
MSDMTRRTVLAGAAVGAAGAGLPAAGPARAAAPPATGQAPGFYRYRVGSMVVTVATDGARTFPMPEGFVRNADKAAVDAALQAAYMEPGKMTIVFNPLAVSTGGKLVLIDTGNGPAAFEQTKGAVGQFSTNLAAAGIAPEAVDAVIISHFHGDHINGLLTADGKPLYPKAEILVPEAEWAFWMDDAAMARAPEGLKGNFANVRRVFGVFGETVTRYPHDKEVLAGITPIATPGHTPGHTSFVLASGNGKVLVQSDVTNHPALFVRNPGWHAMYDMDGAKAEATRRRLFDMAGAEKLQVQGFHFPFPSAGFVEKDGASNYRLVPVAWNPTL